MPIQYFINPRGRRVSRTRKVSGHRKTKTNAPKRRSRTHRVAAAPPRKRRYSNAGRHSVVKRAHHRPSGRRPRYSNPGITMPTAKGVLNTVKQAAVMSAYAFGGRIGNGWLTDLSVGVLNANIQGGVPAVLESGIAVVISTVTGVVLGAVLGEEVAVGWMIGGYMIGAENLVMTYGGKAAAEAMRPLGGYSQLSGYSKMAGYSRPLRGGPAIFPAGVPRRPASITARSFSGTRRGMAQQ